MNTLGKLCVGLPASAVMTVGLAMMTDAETRSMRDSVPGMALYRAKMLPLNDNILGHRMGGMDAAEYQAIIDGADARRVIEPTEEIINRLGDALSARNEYVARLNEAHCAPVNDNREPAAPQYARDGGPLSQLPANERAREEMIIRQSDAWKN